MIEAELPASHYVGESFGISALVGLYYSHDDIAFDDTASARQIDLDLVSELNRLANTPPICHDLLSPRERRPTSC